MHASPTGTVCSDSGGAVPVRTSGFLAACLVRATAFVGATAVVRAAALELRAAAASAAVAGRQPRRLGRQADRPALMRRAVAAATILGGAGAVAVAYAGLIERNAFVLRRFDVPVLAPGSKSLRVLHISDVHMRPDQRRKQRWIRELSDLQPDFIINTGDNLGSAQAVPAVLDTFDAFADIPAVFVLGSNDYYAPTPKNPFKYFFPRHKRVVGDPNPWRSLVDGLVDRGWVDLTNRRTTLSVRGRTIAFAGVDDPHLKHDDRAIPAQPAEADADLRIALVHAPEPRVLDAYSSSGYQLIAAGHTHGGQLRVPFFGALVTNCGIDRPRARGLHRYADAWLHVSAGLGTSPYAPVRFSCRPEASLLTLVARTE